jgi:hypothetical protein
LFLTGMRYQLEGCRRWGRTWGFDKAACQRRRESLARLRGMITHRSIPG